MAPQASEAICLQFLPHRKPINFCFALALARLTNLLAYAQ